jgi:carboxyl-terminal processing protease
MKHGLSVGVILQENRLLLVAGIALFACVGLLLGNVYRSRYETGQSSFVPTEYYATLPVRQPDIEDGDRSMDKPASVYFDDAKRILLETYVDPMNDQTRLSRGVVQQMLDELGDFTSRFYDPAQWKAYSGQFEGNWFGIGADVTVLRQGAGREMQLPLTVISVADDSPAAKAGLQPGDVIEQIGGRAVASRSLWAEVDEAAAKFYRAEITQEELERFFETVRERADNMLTMQKAFEELSVGSGLIEVQIRRDDATKTLKIIRSSFTQPTVVSQGGVIRIRSFGSKTSSSLKEALEGSDEIVLDLRNNPGGRFDVMEQCLALLIPKGPYGRVQLRANDIKTLLDLSEGVVHPKKITVLINEGTAREAELFAVALRDRAGAILKGGPTAGLGVFTKHFELPDGSGYVIESGRLFDLKGNPLFTEKIFFETPAKEETSEVPR